MDKSFLLLFFKKEVSSLLSFATIAMFCGCAAPPPAPIRARLPAIRADAGNLWPGPPARVPTMLDLQAEGVRASAPMPARHRGGAGLCRAKPGQVPAGVALGLCQ